MSDALKLTAYLGERQRADGGYLADALTDVYAEHRLRVSLLMRGAQGFGHKHHLRTDRLLTLSEDLPLVSVAVDTRERITGALDALKDLPLHGLITLERARLGPSSDGNKLTIYVGRREGYRAIVAALQELGVAGATVLLGVDGTVRGERRRARFFAGNADVPVMIIAVGDRVSEAQLPDVVTTLERVVVCKRDGVHLADPVHPPDHDPSGLGIWQKLMVYSGEEHQRLIEQLRRAGAAGATTIRGVWGYHGDHAPHGDTLWQLRRRVPVVTIVVDTPSRMRRWYALIDEFTRESGLVTSELVPAFRATGEDGHHGGLVLARPG